MMADLRSGLRLWPDRVTVPWQRLECGLWRMAEGDIHDAYSADTLPMVRAFNHEGHPFTTLGVHSRFGHAEEAMCYPLVPMDTTITAPASAFYHGREVRWKRKPFRLGARVVFAGTELSVQEWRERLRVIYADGGYFARHSNYAEFLVEMTEKRSAAFDQAVLLEQAGDWIALSKADMVRQLDPTRLPPPTEQLDLGF